MGSDGRARTGFGGGQRRAYDFFREKGLSHNAAAGILASMKQESGFNPRAIGDGGLAHGLFQHHPDRRAAIQRGTGINISTGSFDDQLNGTWWEMNHGDAGAQRALRILRDPDISAHAAGAAFVHHFERPAKDERRTRGSMAAGIAGGPMGDAGDAGEYSRVSRSRRNEYDDDASSADDYRGNPYDSNDYEDHDTRTSGDKAADDTFEDYLAEDHSNEYDTPEPAPRASSAPSGVPDSDVDTVAPSLSVSSIEPDAFAKVRRAPAPQLAPFTAQPSFIGQPLAPNAQNPLIPPAQQGLFYDPNDVDDPRLR